jgi:glycosyltransferase involved in cell wall biosynthesis
MSQSKRLSIILPVYNVEDYVERCIRSLEDQDIPHSDYEVIVVNDGSPDNSRDVVIRLMKEFDNIILIEQENKGVSRARNAGIDRATGEYLLFVDPDDYVEANTFERILSTASNLDAEVVFLGYRFLNVEELPEIEIFNLEEKGRLFTGIKAYSLARGDGKTDPDRSWAVLYRRDFVNKFKLRYISDVPYLEDGEFIARVLCVALRVTFDGRSFYQRTTRPGSATNSLLFFSQTAIDGFARAAANLKRYRENPHLSPEQKEFLNQPICKFVLLVLIPSCSFSRFKVFKTSVQKLRDAGLRKCDLSGCNNWYKIEGWLYNISPFLFFLHRVFKSPLLGMVRP